MCKCAFLRQISFERKREKKISDDFALNFSLITFNECVMCVVSDSFSCSESCNEYEYVLPTEFGKLLPRQFSPSRAVPPESCQTLGRNRAIHLRFQELGLPEISRRRIEILRNLGEGTFGTVRI